MTPTAREVADKCAEIVEGHDRAIALRMIREFAKTLVAQSAVAPTSDYYCGPCNWSGQLPRPPSGHPKCPACGAYLSEPQSASAPLIRCMKSCQRHEGIPFTFTAYASAVVTYCPHCEAESATPDRSSAK